MRLAVASFLIMYIVMDVIMFSDNLLSILLHGVISLPDAMSYDNSYFFSIFI